MNERTRDPRDPVVVLAATAMVLGLVLVALSLGVATSSGSAGATGGGCTDADVTGIGDDPVVVYDASPHVVTGVCIKAGTNPFSGGHSGILGNGTYENGCYRVSGVGTSVVTVERIGQESSACQQISHVDVYTGTPTPTPTPTATTPAATPTPTATTPAEEATPTPTVTPAVLGEVRGPTQLPDTGTGPDGAAGTALRLALLVGGLAMLGGGSALAAVAVRRRR